ncbi:hypothetical protein LguiA_004194 [Lonicera macranthoides]
MIQRLEPDLSCKQGTLSTTSTFPTRTQTLRTNQNERRPSRILIDLKFLHNLEDFYLQHISKNQDDPTVGRLLDNFQEGFRGTHQEILILSLQGGSVKQTSDSYSFQNRFLKQQTESPPTRTPGSRERSNMWSQLDCQVEVSRV